MDPAMISWIISLISGGAGGNAAGAILKDKSLGPIVNSVLGMIGGAAGGQLLPTLIPQLLELLQKSGYLGNAGTSAIIGAIIPLIIGLLKPKKA
jgi:uncharacterized membrane protein YeaQ/YmgE (transglycosylase-associated protein family)